MYKLGMSLLRLRAELMQARALLRDPRAPRSVKLVLIAALLYVLSPIDLVPDLIPGLGWIDDGAIVMLSLQLVRRLLASTPHAPPKAQAVRRAGRRR